VQLMSRYLQTSGKDYTVRFAYDGDEGWKSLCQQPPDLVMLDLFMPGRDGLEIIEAMKNSPSLSRIETLLITVAQFDDEMKDKFESQIHIQRKGGLSYYQILACIKAIVDSSKSVDSTIIKT
jgi:two-component system sensor histidine kinase/response regulator